MQKDVQDDVIKYTFPFDMNYYCICIGASTYFNHSAKPNMKIYRLDKENLKKYFISVKDINIGDEICLYYNDKFNERY